jgi:hypothetical protein
MDIVAALNANAGSITAIATLFLVIITGYYAKKVRDQTKFMQDQSDVMRNSIKRDQLMRKYERLSREMDDLIGPLYSKMDDHTDPSFTVVSHSSEGGPFYQEIFAFWRDIKKNIYLAPRDLQESLGNYLEARQKFRRVQKNMTTPGEEATAVRNLFDKAIDDLMPKIKDRYNELNKRLEERENELEN